MQKHSIVASTFLSFLPALTKETHQLCIFTKQSNRKMESEKNGNKKNTNKENIFTDT